jgi:hypothetical protein
MKIAAAKIFARYIVNKNKKWVNNPVSSQKQTLKKLIASGSKTLFGKDHNFNRIQTTKLIRLT